MTGALRASSLPLTRLRRGKVRDVYVVDAERLLVIATDRVSAFDVVLAEPVPCKGAVLTQLTAWWLRTLGDVVAHHLITADTDAILADVPILAPHRDVLAGRSMLVRRAEVFPVECVVRGYLAGSGWTEYQAHGTLAGEPLPAGLRQGDALPSPRFTPATKADQGHDENITRTALRERLGPVAPELERLSLALYARGALVAERAGLVLADTKFEFGTADGGIILVDEVMTPDSSRLWARDARVPGQTPPSFDKQPLRDYLAAERAAGRWNGEPPGPALPSEVVAATSARYREAFGRLTGDDLPAVACE